MSAETIQRAAVIFLALALVAAAVMYLLYRAQASAARSIFWSAQAQVVELGKQRILANLGFVISDIAYLAEQEAVQRSLAGSDPQAPMRLAADYLAFAAHKPVYDHVRLLDAAGHDVANAEPHGPPTLTPGGELGDALEPHLTEEILQLDQGQIYASPLQLNVENGAVAQPPQPIMRFGTPVFDAMGIKRGMIVLNYLGNRLLRRTHALAQLGPANIWLLNKEGYWLLGPNPADEWGFMYPDGRSRTFGQAYPEAWQSIGLAAGSGQLIAGGDLFSYSAVLPGEARTPYAVETEPAFSLLAADSWILIAHVPAGVLAAQTAPLMRNFALAFAALLVLLALVSWLIGRQWTARRGIEQSIRASEVRFRGFLESAPDAVVIADAEGRIVYANAQTQRMFGYPRDDLVGREIEMLLPERHRARHVGHRSAYAAAPRARAMGENLDLYGLRRDGTEFPVAISLSPVETVQGPQIFADIRDMTERRQAERQLQALNEQLERDYAALDSLNKELEAFSYSVSHDLRAPLRAIDGFSQALLEDYSDRLDGQGRNYLNRVRYAAQRMGQLIDDLLKLARVTRAELTMEEVDLSAIAEEIGSALQEGVPHRRAEFVVEPGLHVRGDARLLRVALENLLSNAWKFTEGRSPARIELGLSQVNGTTSFFVRDNGVGFDMQYAGKLFGAFQRLHDAAEFPGTGIGLATVQRVVRKHGGRIWAEAEHDRGATFNFTLSP